MSRRMPASWRRGFPAVRSRRVLRPRAPGGASLPPRFARLPPQNGLDGVPRLSLRLRRGYGAVAPSRLVAGPVAGRARPRFAHDPFPSGVRPLVCHKPMHQSRARSGRRRSRRPGRDLILKKGQFTNFGETTERTGPVYARRHLLFAFGGAYTRPTVGKSCTETHKLTDFAFVARQK